MRVSMIFMGLALSASLSAEAAPPTPEEMALFALHWTKTNVIIGDSTGDFEAPDLLCFLAGECRLFPNGGEMRSLMLFDNTRISSLEADPNTRYATAVFDLGEDPYVKASLVVDLDSTCFPFEEWTDPPEGENWPADCDAFDRLFTFVIDGGGGQVGFEVVRAVTPFGGQMHLEADLTHLVNALTGVHSITVFISTISDSRGLVTGSAGGWNVTATLDLLVGIPEKEVISAIPLWNGVYRSDTTQPVILFIVPSGADEAFIEYRVTGHGTGVDTTGG
ncbi:MAG: hypothetical protein KC964_23420, partial [Candidatus Omnitrophica bacterium]|nr:hypothetical protein [Candidatus Omnitrophota bacterium]